MRLTLYIDTDSIQDRNSVRKLIETFPSDSDSTCTGSTSTPLAVSLDDIEKYSAVVLNLEPKLQHFVKTVLYYECKLHEFSTLSAVKSIPLNIICSMYPSLEYIRLLVSKVNDVFHSILLPTAFSLCEKDKYFLRLNINPILCSLDYMTIMNTSNRDDEFFSLIEKCEEADICLLRKILSVIHRYNVPHQKDLYSQSYFNFGKSLLGTSFLVFGYPKQSDFLIEKTLKNLVAKLPEGHIIYKSPNVAVEYEFYCALSHYFKDHLCTIRTESYW